MSASAGFIFVSARRLLVVGLLSVALLLAGAGTAQADRAAEDAATEAFFNGPILHWVITLPEESLAALRRDPRAYARGQLRVGTNDLRNVGFHLKGSAGSKRSVDDKPAWTIDINRFHPGRTVYGQDKFHLNNSVQDSSYLNQNLASRVYRAAGIPATRATHALVTLNGRDLGVYVAVETYDDRYLRRAFPEEGNRPGNLYEGAFVGDIDRRLQRDAGHGPGNQSDLILLRQAIEAPLPQRLAELQQVLDIDKFLTFSAIQLTLDDWDGYLRNRNNYRIHFRAGDGRAVFLPSGVDQILVHADAPVRDGWRSRVPTALFGLPGLQLQLRRRLRELSSNILSEQFLTNELARLQSRLDAAVADRPAVERDRLFPDRYSPPFRVHRRLQTVSRELATWPDPLPPWPPGHRVRPADWQVYVQFGQADVTAPTNGPMHLIARAAGTIASLRTTLTVPAGAYRLTARARTSGVLAIRDQFGAGAGVRLTGSSRIQALEGDTDWTPMSYEFQTSDDGPVGLIVELRADAGEVWFEDVQVTGK